MNVVLITASYSRFQGSMVDRYSLHFRRVAFEIADNSRKSHVWSPNPGETGKVQAHSEIAHRRTMSFYAFARFKEIHLLWIMPRFPARWRASRIQYLRPLSSYSRCSGLERQRAHRDRYWGAWVVLFILVPVLLFRARYRSSRRTIYISDSPCMYVYPRYVTSRSRVHESPFCIAPLTQRVHSFSRFFPSPHLAQSAI